MPAKRVSVKAKKPLSVWKKPVKLSFREFFVSMSKAIYHGAVAEWKNLAEDVVKGIGLISLKTTPEEIAWTLVCRAIVRAMFDLIGEALPFSANATPPDETRFLNGVEQSIDKAELFLDPSFFRKPTKLPVFEVLKQPMSEWLVAHGAFEPDARCIVNRLPSYFVYALHVEWQKQPADYERLRGALDTPFAKASEREEAWERYAARLQRQLNEPMFGEPFGLAFVYVPLRAYYEEPTLEGNAVYTDGRGARTRDARDQRVRRIVVDLESELCAWLEESNRSDAIRVVAGGPGSGKSSFTKVFAARQMTSGRRLLYVPLHLIDPEKDLEESIGQFVRQQGILEDNPLDPKLGESRILLLLDGLDELAMQGRAAAEVAQKFILEVQRLVANRNHDEVRVQVLIGGREIVVQMSQAELRKARQVLHVLPYLVPEKERKDYHDPSNLLQTDQRDLWWRNYAIAKGKKDQAMPRNLRRPDLGEVTAQPLLGYLVALSYGRGEIDLGKVVNLNQIYADLVKAVHERSYGDRPHPSVRGLGFEEFSRLLEEVAVAAWHGDGRTTTSEAIFQRCEKCGLRKLLDAFEEGAKAGATRLLAAFYFRQQGVRNDGARTFEFTHKSFGEYLIAKRIVRTIEDLNEEMERRIKSPGRGWDERTALCEWAQVFGPAAMDVHILRFLVDEVRLRNRDDVRSWQMRLAHLIGWMLRLGMPMDMLDHRIAYIEQVRQARNAEEALLACTYACANTSHQRTHVDWPDAVAFGAWIRRLQGQRSAPQNMLALDCLSWLDLRGTALHMIDLYRAKLINADVSGVSGRWANLAYALLSGANLEGANLEGANLEGAKLEGANLKGANLQEVILARANLEGANLEGADLQDANFERASMLGANFTMARVDRALMSNEQLASVHGKPRGKASLSNVPTATQPLPPDPAPR